MKMIRRIINKILPEWWRDRIDLETRGIRLLMEKAANEIPDHSRILDAGAGQSPYRKLFSQQNYIAFDFAKGESTWDYSHLDVVGSLEKLPFKSDTFDVAISTQVLEHVSEPEMILREMNRTMKPGATLYLTAPLGFGEHQKPYDFFRYTQFGLKHLLEKSGYVIDSIQARGGYFWYMAVMGMWFYSYLFPAHRKRGWKILFSPIQALAAIWFILIAPPLISSFDFLDYEKAITLGYAVIARKKEASEV